MLLWLSVINEGWYVENYRAIAERDLSDSLQDETQLARKASDDARRLGSVAGLRVLEVGPGQGHLARLLTRAGARVDLVDVVETYLKRLAPAVSGQVFVENVEQLSMNRSYDWVILADVLEHVLNPGDALLSAWSVLRPGGKIYLRSPSYESLVRYSRRLGCPWEAVHLRTYTPYLLNLELRYCGFDLVRKARTWGAPFRLPRLGLLPAAFPNQNKLSLSSYYGATDEMIARYVNFGPVPTTAFLARLLGRIKFPFITLPGEVWAIGRRPSGQAPLEPSSR